MLIIFDKDDTLVKTFDGRPPNTLAEQVLFDDVLEKTEALRTEGHTLAVASNQGGVAFGHFDREAAVALVRVVSDAIGATTYALCVCHPQGNVPGTSRESQLRKPNPGMIFYLMDALGFSPNDTLFVGDRDVDQQAAEAAGVRFEWANIFFERG